MPRCSVKRKLVSQYLRTSHASNPMRYSLEFLFLYAGLRAEEQGGYLCHPGQLEASLELESRQQLNPQDWEKITAILTMKSRVVLHKGWGGRQNYIWSHSLAEKTQLRNKLYIRNWSAASEEVRFKRTKTLFCHYIWNRDKKRVYSSQCSWSQI